MRAYELGGRTVLLNAGERDVILADGDLGRAAIELHVGELTDLAPGARKSFGRTPTDRAGRSELEGRRAHAAALLAAHAAGRVLLSPRHFTTGSDEPFTVDLAEYFLKGTALGRSLKSELGKAGLDDVVASLTARSSQGHYTSKLTLLLASLTMATHGADDLGSLPLEAFRDWLMSFRTTTGDRWREDLWPSSREVAFRCLREIAFAYGRATGRMEVCRLVPQSRAGAAISGWKTLAAAPPPHIQPWLELFLAWRAERPAFAKRYRQMFLHFARWLDTFPPERVADIPGFLTRPGPSPGFAEHLAKRHQETGDIKGAKAVVEYIGQAARFSAFIVERLAVDGVVVTLVEPVTASDVERAKNAMRVQGRGERRAEAASRPLPMRLYSLTRSILEEGERGWPGRHPICRETVIGPDGRPTEVYCPVLPTLYLSLFEVPLRVAQAKRLDSGEGDVRRFDGHTLSWGENRGPLAGFWRDHCREEHRGYAFEIPAELPGDRTVTGFAVNTNKTGAPYCVPWQNPTLHRLFYDLRLWQEKHNPVTAPIGPELYVDGIEEADEGKIADYPEIFPLFRLPPRPEDGGVPRPPNARKVNQFWQHLMAEVERRWNEGHPASEHISIVKRQGGTGQPYGAKYNPHGLRVAGITHMVHQGVPIEVVSKLVAGHTTLLMTLYYVRFEPGYVDELLGLAAQGRATAAAEAVMRELKSLGLEEARMRAAFIHEDGVQAATLMDAADKLMWADTGIGICPWDGGRCGDGGPLLKKDVRSDGKDCSVYGPVPGGPRTCVNCRHFVTGPAWELPLWLFGTKLLRRFAAKAERATAIQEEIERLHGLLKAAAEDGLERRRIAKHFAEHEAELNAVTADQEVIATGIWNTHRLLEACRAVAAAESGGDAGGGGDSLGAVVASEHGLVEYREAGAFFQAALLTEASRVYPILHDAETETARDRFLDLILWNSGNIPLTLAPLAPEEKRRGRDALGKFLLNRVKREEAEALAAGHLRLQDLGVEHDALAAATLSIGRPVTAVAFQPAGRP